MSKRILCVYPRFNPGFASFHHSFQFFPGAQAFMPPQGILTIAAYAERRFEVRLIDENVTALTEADIAWADAVFVSGMHPQRRRMAQIARQARAMGKLAVAGGPSVSGCAEYHPDFHILHVGELGDATDRLFDLIEASCARPAQQIVLTTQEKTPIEDFPIPAYHLLDLKQYMILSIQWSSGCPFNCEFCDIPELYGRRPRYKSAPRLLRELDEIMKQNPVGAIMFVDDNLIGNRKAAKELMPHLIDWQQRTGYQVRFTGEASIDLAGEDELLALMREAHFTDLFVGIESADRDTLVAISKKQNVRMPLLDAVRKLNSYGIEISSGIIFGFDSDGTDTADKAIAFVEQTQVPIIGFNMLYALPSTPLWRRLQKEGRLLPDNEAGESNIRFKLPAETINSMYTAAVENLYAPKALYERFKHNALNTYGNRKKLPMNRYSLASDSVKYGLKAMGRVLWKIGVRSAYRREFWKLAWVLLKNGHMDQLVYAGAMGHHFIQFRNDILAGRVRLSTFSHREGEDTAPQMQLAA